MAYCDSCRGLFEQYQYISKEVIPSMAASAAAEATNLPQESATSLKEAEQRLMASVGSASRPQRASVPTNMSWKILGGALAAGVLVVLVFAYSHFIRRSSPQPASSVANADRAKYAGSPPTTQAKDSEIDRALRSREEEVTQLQQQLVALESRSTKDGTLSLALQQQLRKEEKQRDQMASEQVSLSNQFAAAQADIQAMREKLSATQAGADLKVARVSELEAKVRSLNAALDDSNTALNDRDRMLALDKDFLAHDRDIRDLIGARNLYIADIYDTTENGKTAKPFGRIFYTQDRSLVFYGFDLDKQADLQRSVAFQAWGSGSDRQPVSLGLFYEDDNHKRWVVRCNDAKTLARLNMVFVTIEPPGGSSKPTGKQLLRAYLQIQPNHP
jgi:hypothetical protein